MPANDLHWRKSTYSHGNGGNCVEVAAWRKSTHSGGNGGDCVEVAAAWRKSTHSHGNGGACVEIAPAWRKSTHSGGNGGACVEVAGFTPATGIRDSKDPDGPALFLTANAWHTFTTQTKSGTHDLP
ncbi:DUF397 domain-containing protein [Actinomadura atramentaria]|uniref:DUF397 domain-containing protein n=1 Tax=Actinomadura atramentaria TaxID=1990 RepID=UPI000A01E194|nr:DUF397 domain-containing protein [Actinomadura atramentaria]